LPSNCLPREPRVPKASLYCGRSRIDLDASGLSQRGLREPATEDADSGNFCFSRSGGVVRGIDDAEESKPAPDIFEVALKKLGIKGADAVAIGVAPLLGGSGPVAARA
jgi:hypothetical protein